MVNGKWWMVNGGCFLRTHFLRTMLSLLFTLYSMISTLIFSSPTSSDFETLPHTSPQSYAPFPLLALG